MNETKINLSFTKNYFGEPHFKARLFEICSCGSFALPEYFEGNYEFLKKGEELVMFKNKEELVDKINYFLKNETERETIAKKAHIRIIKERNQDKDFERIFKKILNEKNNRRNIPNIKNRAYLISENEIKMDSNLLEKKLKKYSAIIFDKDKTDNKFREYFQLYSLNKSKKTISCCDYYISSKNLKDYLHFTASYAFKVLEKDEFLKLSSKKQFMVDKNFFLNNKEETLKLIKKEENNLLKEENIVFVSIPLVRINNVNNIEKNKMKEVFLPKFENELRKLKFKNRLFKSRFTYHLILNGLYKNRFILEILKQKFLTGKHKNN